MSDWPDDLAERRRVAAKAFGDRVSGVRDWSAPAPPEGWVARDVVTHLLEWLPGLLSHSVSIELPPVDTGDGADLAQAWERRAADVDGLFESDGDKVYESEYFGRMTVADLIDRFYTSDVVLHTWDLARATGQDDRLPRTFCEQSFAGMEPLADMLASSGQYAPRVPVPDDADIQDRLIGLIGRDPSWRPPG